MLIKLSFRPSCLSVSCFGPSLLKPHTEEITLYSSSFLVPGKRCAADFNSCLMQLAMTTMRATAVNLNSNAAGCNTKTMDLVILGELQSRVITYL